MQARYKFAIGTVGLLFGTVTFAHDDADWIERNPRYVSENGTHCCGSGDCRRVGEDHFRQVGDTIFYLPTMQKFRHNGPGVHRSETADWWACIPGRTDRTETLPPLARCIFFPFHTQ